MNTKNGIEINIMRSSKRKPDVVINRTASKKSKPVILSALSKSNRIWQRRQAALIDAALSAAENDVVGPLWLTADKRISDLGDLLPECLLPRELSDRIAALRLEPLPTELWRIVADYAAFDDCNNDYRIERIIYARAVCLHSAGGRTADAIALLDRTSTAIDWNVDYSLDLAVKLFVVQRYDAAIHLYGRILEQSICNDQEDATGSRGEAYLYRALSLVFVGRIDEAAADLDRHDQDGYNRHAWYAFAREIMQPTPSRNRLLAVRTAADDEQYVGMVIFLKALISTILAADTLPSMFDAGWLRGRHALAVAASDLTSLDYCNLKPESCPRLSSADLTALVSSRF